MWERLGTCIIFRKVNQLTLDRISNTDVRGRTIELLKRKDLHQIIRREICFGLIPKTLQCTLQCKLQFLW